MSVDKTLEELGSFTDLVTESAMMDKDWQIVLIAGLGGSAGIPPTTADAEKPIETMIETVRSGRDLSKYLALDRDGNPVHFR